MSLKVQHLPTLADAVRFVGDNFPFKHEEQWTIPPGAVVWHIYNRKHAHWFPCPVGWWVVRRAPGDAYVVDGESFPQLWRPLGSQESDGV